MELIYSMRRKPLKCEPPHFASVSDPEVIRPICTISSCNIIAFSSPTELTDSDGDTWGGHVYVCDLDTPWDSHKVTSTTHPVSVVEWDGEGKLLLVATTVGEVSVYAQKDYLLNEWTCLYSANFPGEHILKGVFFHHGRRVVALDKKGEALTDRVQALRPAPTLKGFGGGCSEGLCVVTASGLVCSVCPPQGEAARALTATDTLRARREHVTHAAFAHKNGSLLLAAVQRGLGAQCAVVRCAVVSCARSPAAPASPAPAARRAFAALTIQPLPAVSLTGPPPSSIAWSLRDECECLLVAGAGAGGAGTLTMWKLVERAHPVHKLLAKGPLQGGTTPGGGQKPATDCFNTVVWQPGLVWSVPASAGASVCVVRAAPGAPHVLLAAPRALHLLARDNQHYICSRPLPSGAGGEPPSGATTPPKKHKYANGMPQQVVGSVLSCADISWLCGVAVSVDTRAQLHVYRLPQPWHDVPTPVAVQHLSGVLEYALLAGVDCLDVLLTVKHGLAEHVYERVSETFQRQPASLQQYYYHGWLKLRIALCRLTVSGQSSASSLISLQMCAATWAAAASALRPDDRPELATLAALLDEQHPEHDKALLTLEAKSDVCVDVSSLHALRRPLQRAADIAATALAAAHAHHAQHANTMHAHTYELCCDPVAVNLLRKLLVLCRGACGDQHAAAGRMLARLHAATHHKTDIMEECAALLGQMSAPRVWEALPRCSVAAPHNRHLPIYLQYGVEPEALRFSADPPAAHAQSDTTPSINMDSIRYMYLGGGSAPARWRHCRRCGARALPHPQPARHPLQRAYDGRFIHACRCGGKWSLFSNL